MAALFADIAPLVLLAVAVAAGAFLQGATGIGFALVAAPVCALVLEAAEVVGTVARLAAVVDLVLLLLHRSDVDLRVVRGYLWPAAVVAPLAVVASALLAPGVLVLGAAVVTLAAVAAVALLPHESEVAPTSGSPVLAGAASGFLGITTGLSGPPVALDSLRRGMAPARARATLAAFFLVVDLVAVAVHRQSTPPPTKTLVIGALLGGLALGRLLAGRVPDHALRTAMILVVAASAIAAGARQLL